ncbi:MAG: VWA domain-containing protein [Candidatus Riflebacteria bacterium]|nr:VWA domain-containing protein [Candidatus Riflebacteria bacterium]
MSDALISAGRLLRGTKNTPVTILFTDGQPDSTTSTIMEAGRLKDQGARLVTIGIGADVDGKYLKSLASAPGDYYFVNDIYGLQEIFRTIMNGLKTL